MIIEFQLTEVTSNEAAKAASILDHLSIVLAQAERESNLAGYAAVDPSRDVPTPPSDPSPNIPAPPSDPPGVDPATGAVRGGLPSGPPDAGTGANNPPPPTAEVTYDVASGVDQDGLIWDRRINTKNKSKTAKGIWKRKPRLKDEFVDAVKAELRQIMANGVSAPDAGAGANDPPPPPADLPPKITFGEFVDKTLKRLADGSLVKAEVDTALSAAGLTELSQLASLKDENLQMVARLCEEACQKRTGTAQ